MKKIEFIPTEFYAEHFFEDCIKSANQAIPQWYKSMDMTFGKHKSLSMDPYINGINGTMKACAPFLDSITSGYFYTTPTDIQISQDLDTGEIFFNWSTEIEDFVTFHPNEQAEGFPQSPEFYDLFPKWIFKYIINTPPGYSTLFTHPFNREDLPFYTLSGVVDTDTYSVPVNFPFRLKKFDQQFITIKKGTPLIQIIPFKRENWSKQLKKESKESIDKKNFSFHSKLSRSYKSQYWKKKQYK